MGDRANIVVYEAPGTGPLVGFNAYEAVFLYTHWNGSELPGLLKAGLERGVSRWNDAPYLARILFQAMLDGDEATTGYGISTRLTDNEHPLLVVDTDTQMVIEYPEAVYRARGFGALANYRGVPFAEYSGEWAREGSEEVPEAEAEVER